MNFKFGFGSEPALVSEALRLGLLLLVSFGLPITTEQQVMILGLGSIVLTILTRQNVTSQDTLREAGFTQKGITEQAASNTAIAKPTKPKSVDDILNRDK